MLASSGSAGADDPIGGEIIADNNPQFVELRRTAFAALLVFAE
jgi:hypothetical protein